MPDPERDTASRYTSSTGQALASISWLDAHFEAMRPEYEAMLRSVGIAPGWRVLDAGCGGGNYLPWLAELAGPTGSLVALDLAPENVATARERLAEWSLPCPVEVQVGTVLALPYPDARFDAAWCAAVTQYLGDDELRIALAELRRVVRPGGLVAVKDGDIGLYSGPDPANPALWWHYLEAASRVSAQVRQAVRSRELRRWLVEAGLREVWQRTTVADRWQPLRPVERQYLSYQFAFGLRQAPQVGLSESDLATSQELCEPSSPGYVLDRPDYQFREGHILAVGRV